MHTIDATDKKIGRVASQAAVLLMGKDKQTFARHLLSDDKVIITNASKLSIPTVKRQQKIYQRYSGYPGGRSERTMEKVIEMKGYSELLRKAIYGMLPTNKLRPRMMKNLIISE